MWEEGLQEHGDMKEEDGAEASGEYESQVGGTRPELNEYFELQMRQS